MIKLSLFIMIGLTVVFAIGLRWREDRVAAVRAATPTRPGWVAQQKRKLNRWTAAAALAAVATILLLGGLNWLRVWQGGP